MLKGGCRHVKACKPVKLSCITYCIILCFGLLVTSAYKSGDNNENRNTECWEHQEKHWEGGRRELGGGGGGGGVCSLL